MAKYPRIFLIGNFFYKNFYFLYQPSYFLYKRISDRKKISILNNIIKPGMLVVDIGANIGFYSVLLSRLVGSTGKVYAFEPDENNFKHLRNNTNDLKNVVINKLAVADKNRKMKLYTSADLNVDHNTYDNGEGRNFVEIDAVSLDEYFCKAEKVDFIKIDIQGFDYYAMLGAKNIVSRSNNLMVISEFWPYGLNKAGVKPTAFLDLFKALNFQIDSNIDDMAVDDKISDYRFYLDIFCYKNN